MHYVNPLVEKLHLVDVKAQVKRLERQEVMTCDQVRFWVLFFFCFDYSNSKQSFLWSSRVIFLMLFCVSTLNSKQR